MSGGIVAADEFHFSPSFLLWVFGQLFFREFTMFKSNYFRGLVVGVLAMVLPFASVADGFSGERW